MGERLPDWRDRLMAYLVKTRRVPFAWGQNDCVLWAAGAVEAMTGLHPAMDFLGAYATDKTAISILRASGWKTLLDAAKARLEVEDVPCAQGEDGDIIWMPGWNRIGILCIMLRPAIWCPNECGLARIPMQQIIRHRLVRAVPVGVQCRQQ